MQESGMHEKMFNWSKEHEEDKRLSKQLKSHNVCIPRIDEIRAIQHEGETYYNAKDLSIAMQQYAYTTIYSSASVLGFIRQFTIQLITAFTTSIGRKED
jgi:hypothetical protein